ncbi:MAG: DUF5305 domain-containing protein, partial [Clostridiales bacterium]|nr:DUF5305 domain-containing protein [Clostridiales bacterium]
MNGDTEKEVYKGLPKEKKKIARIHISRSIRTFIIVSLSASILSSCLYWYFVEFHQKLVPESVPVYSYSCKADVTYKVMLLPNDIVPEESLGENKAYISQFVDYIDTAFAFEYSGDEEAQLSGSYGATAYLRGVVTGLGDNVVLWTKEYELIPQTEFHKTGHQAAVNYRAPVDYNSIREYGEAVKDFLDISSNLQLSVVYTLSIDAETEKGTVHEEFAPSITIPVSGDYFRITKNTEGEKAGTIDESRQTVSPHYRMKKNFCYTAAGSLSLALLFV